MKQDQVTIVIPALNEAGAIAEVVGAIRQQLPDTELIVVNDGSSDNTAELAAEAGARVINHDHPCGYGASLKTGTEEASRPYVLFCDGDGQHSVEDVQRLIAEADGFDMVVGMRGSDSHSPLTRRPGKMILKWFADYLAGQKIPDLNSGLRIFKKETLLRYIHLMPDGFSFSTTSTFAMLKTHRKVKYIPITVKQRVGKSTVRPIRHGMQTILLMVRLTVLFEPLKVFLVVAAFLFCMTSMSLLFDTTMAGGLSDTTVLLSIASLIVFMFGLLCDQVSALRRELHEHHNSR